MLTTGSYCWNKVRAESKVRPESQVRPENQVGPENKVGPKNQVGPRIRWAQEGNKVGHKNQVGPGNKVGPGNNFKILEPSGSCGSICLVKLVSKNPFLPNKRVSGFEMERKQVTNKLNVVESGGPGGRGWAGGSGLLLHESQQVAAKEDSDLHIMCDSDLSHIVNTLRTP